MIVPSTGTYFCLLIKLTNSFNDPYFEIYEVQYVYNNTHYAWAESHNILLDDTVEELKESYEYMRSVLKMPVLKVVKGKLVELIEDELE